MSIFGGAEPQRARPAPFTPTRADASSFVAGTGRRDAVPDRSLISTGPRGLKRKGDTEKKTLIGAT